MGTGPYMFDHWTPGEELVLKANENYWAKEPLWEGGPSGAPAIKTVIIKQVEEFSTRLAMTQAGDADNNQIGSLEDWPILDELVGEEGTYEQYMAGEPLTVVDATKPFRKITEILAVTSRDDVGFQFKINTEGGNSYVGSGKLDGDGIPATFFSDVHVRRAFSYCFDFDTYLNEVLQGEGKRAPVLVLPGMAGYDESAPQYTYDIEKCKAELAASTWTTCTQIDNEATFAATQAKAAADAVTAFVPPVEGAPVVEGEEAPKTLEQLTADKVAADAAAAEAKAAADACEAKPLSEVGFRLSAVYNAGNTGRQTIAELIQSGMQEAGTQYVVEAVSLPWPTFLQSSRAKKLPIMIVGWISDYYDAHNWTSTFTSGYYAFRQSFPEEVRREFGVINTEGVQITDPVARDQFYKDTFNPKYHDFAPAMLLFHTSTRSYLPMYVKGWYANAMYSGRWYYVLSKD